MSNVAECVCSFPTVFQLANRWSRRASVSLPCCLLWAFLRNYQCSTTAYLHHTFAHVLPSAPVTLFAVSCTVSRTSPPLGFALCVHSSSIITTITGIATLVLLTLAHCHTPAISGSQWHHSSQDIYFEALWASCSSYSTTLSGSFEEIIINSWTLLAPLLLLLFGIVLFGPVGFQPWTLILYANYPPICEPPQPHWRALSNHFGCVAPLLLGDAHFDSVHDC